MSPEQQVVSVIAPTSSGWTVETYAIHNEALRSSEWKFQEERDRRYAEVATEREKALKIKETADLAALGLAREIQTYKDEKANELREQINSERHLYATKTDLVAAVEKIGETLAPISTYVGNQQGRLSGWNDVRLLVGVVIGAAGFLYAVLAK